MATKKLSRLKLDPALARAIEVASRRGLRLNTVGDVLHYTDYELVEMLDVPHAMAAHLLELASRTAAPRPTTALALLQAQSRKIKTGVHHLDRALCGGVRCGEITEVAGTPGSGKTQLCLTTVCFAVCRLLCADTSVASDGGRTEGGLAPRASSSLPASSVADDNMVLRGPATESGATTAATAATEGEGVYKAELTATARAQLRQSGVVYFDTEGMFNPARVRAVALARFPGIFDTASNPNGDLLLDALLAQIHVFRVHSLRDFMKQLALMEHSFLIEHATSLLVLDSIPSLIEKEEVRIQRRQQLLGEIAAKLKFLAETFSVAVLATNHVVAARGRAGRNGSGNHNGSGPSCGAIATGGGLLDLFDDDDDPAALALGNTWSHCVNTRFVLSTSSRFDTHSQHDYGHHHREDEALRVLLSVHKSPLLGPQAFPCAIGCLGFAARGQ